MTSPVSRSTIFAPSPASAAARAAHRASSSRFVLTSRLPATRISKVGGGDCIGFARYTGSQFGCSGENHSFVLVMAASSITGSFIGGRPIGLILCAFATLVGGDPGTLSGKVRNHK
jgi:hypothetical protein